MEGSNLPSGNMTQGTHYGSLDFHDNSLQMHDASTGKQVFSQPRVPSNFSAFTNRVPESGQLSEFQFGEPGKTDHPPDHHNHEKNCMNNDEQSGMTEDATNNQRKGMKDLVCQRMKWTGAMVRLLVTAVSYTGEDTGTDLGSGKSNSTVMQKKGKWKAISKVMYERGYDVSPQQCEDKFNDLNKRYKRLTDILGRGTSCKVVENPALLDHMDDLSNKMKYEARKILSSKHLFYEVMCSYHNNNRLNLPEDPALQHSLQLALVRRGAGTYKYMNDYEDDGNDDDEHHAVHGNKEGPFMRKRMRQTVDIEDEKELSLHSAKLEKHLLKIKVQELELRKKCLKWERSCKKKDRVLQKMRLENERVKIENELLELELRHKELELKGNHSRA